MHTHTKFCIALLGGLLALGAVADLAAAQGQPPASSPAGNRLRVRTDRLRPHGPQLREVKPPRERVPDAARLREGSPPVAQPPAAQPAPTVATKVEKVLTVEEKIALRAPEVRAKAGEHALAGTRAQPVTAKKDFLGLIVFFLLAFGCAGFAVVMITRKSPMMSALSLLVVFLCLAGIYVMLKAPFMAAIELIVYAGAVIVLFIFVIMSMGLEETYSPRDMAKELAYFMAGFLLTGAAALVFFFAEGLRAVGMAGLLLAATLAGFVVYLRFPFTRFLGVTAAAFAAVQITRLATLTTVVLEVPRTAPDQTAKLLNVASPLADDFGSPQAVGRSVFLDNAFTFEALSLLLLAAIVAAVVIVRSRKEAAS